MLTFCVHCCAFFPIHSEALSEDASLPVPTRNLASLVAAKVYFHLGAMRDALTCAIRAGDALSLEERSEFVQSIVSTAIDLYIAQRVQKAKPAGVVDAETLPQQHAGDDAALAAVVERMFARCHADGEYAQAIGIALESRRLDQIEAAIVRATDAAAVLRFAMRAATTYVLDLAFRSEVLRLLVRLLQQQSEPDFFSVAQCLVALNDAETLATILQTLISRGDQHSTLVAYQIAFDLVQSAQQHFLSTLMGKIEHAALKTILSGSISVDLQRDFLSRHAHADATVLTALKAAVDPRLSVLHGALVSACGIMYAGTGVDDFLRSNIEWMRRAVHWNQFSTVAALGSIHAGSHSEADKLLDRFFASPDQYSKAGGYFALGLAAGSSARGKIVDGLRNAGSSTVVQHGTCLGIAVSSLATADAEIYDLLRNVLYQDDAVAGEAAGLAMGWLYAGSLTEEVVQDLLAYSRETQHEKIIRGIALGLAALCHGKEQGADALIAELSGDKDALLRCGAMQCLASAYVGTSNPDAVRRALAMAVRDVSDDVRRAAVIALGFILKSTSVATASASASNASNNSTSSSSSQSAAANRGPRLMASLAQSYNAHVRYGAALAVGVCCAGTASSAALDVLRPLLVDVVDFVRQGAYMATAMVLMQTNATREPYAADFRAEIEKVVQDRHTPQMAKMGAILASGIIDAGGRNVMLEIGSMRGALGLLVALQYWYWYPYTSFLQLALAPSHVTALTAQLKMPQLQIVSHARPSLFAYPPPRSAKKEDKARKVMTVDLSKRGKEKEKDKEKEKEKEKKRLKEEKEEKKREETEKAEEMQVEEEILQNPARVTAEQAAVIEFRMDAGERYVPVKAARGVYGVVMVEDRRPGEPEELLQESKSAAAIQAAKEANEPAAPAPFTWP
jgi:26S proteasome regulatory subunit N2